MVFMEFTRYCYFLDAFSGQKGVRKLVFKCVPTIICRGKWYFVTIIVLTYCEKKLFWCEEKNLEKSLQIRGRKAKNL